MQRKQTRNRLFRTYAAQAFTLIELLVVLAIIVVAGMLVPTLAKDHTKAPRLQCANNLKNVGLAFHIFANDHRNRYPMALSTNEGGSSEYTATANAAYTYMHYRTMSNELNTPKILVCPADGGKALATNWTTHMNVLKNKAVSYFVGLDADETRPQSILSGDRNVTNDLPLHSSINKSELIRLGTNHTAVKGAGWTRDLHQEHGNILLSDGSVHYVNTARLKELLKAADGDNLFAFPGN